MKKKASSKTEFTWNHFVLSSKSSNYDDPVYTTICDWKGSGANLLSNVRITPKGKIALYFNSSKDLSQFMNIHWHGHLTINKFNYPLLPYGCLRNRFRMEDIAPSWRLKDVHLHIKSLGTVCNVEVPLIRGRWVKGTAFFSFQDDYDAACFNEKLKKDRKAGLNLGPSYRCLTAPAHSFFLASERAKKLAARKETTTATRQPPSSLPPSSSSPPTGPSPPPGLEKRVVLAEKASKKVTEPTIQRPPTPAPTKSTAKLPTQSSTSTARRPPSPQPRGGREVSTMDYEVVSYSCKPANVTDSNGKFSKRVPPALVLSPPPSPRGRAEESWEVVKSTRERKNEKRSKNKAKHQLNTKANKPKTTEKPERP